MGMHKNGLPTSILSPSFRTRTRSGTLSSLMNMVWKSIGALCVALSLAHCAPFQPEVALRPVPYRADTAFSLVPTVRMRPDYDRGTFRESPEPRYQHTPEELSATPTLVAQCLTSRAAFEMQPYQVTPNPTAPAGAGAFVLEFGIVSARPGFYRSDRQSAVTATASANAPATAPPTATTTASGATATGGAAMDTAAHGTSGQAEVMLEVRNSTGATVDRVRLFAQRFPGPEESIEDRAGTLCTMLLTEAQQYIAWRLAGHGL